MDSKKPLEGIRVVELANYVAAPVVGRFLADLGAEVIKIEGRGGDAWRASCIGFHRSTFDEIPLFDLFNLGKKSLSLNIKTEDGMRILWQLLDKADIFLTNTRQKSLVKLGIDYDSIKDKYPRLIYATVTGYGYKGPDCDAPGFDNIAFWSRSGIVADLPIKTEKYYPINSRFAMGDTMTGSLFFGSVMTALYQRERTGKGDFVTMSLFNAGIWASCGGVVMTQEPYNYPMPEGRFNSIPMNLPYMCSDGEWVRCTFYEFDRYAPKFFGSLGILKETEELGINSSVSATDNAQKLEPLIAEAYRKQPSDYWVKVFSDLDIVCGKLSHFKDVSNDEQAWANEYLQKYDCCNGAERVMPSCPVRLGTGGAFSVGKAFLCGENNDEIMEGLGYTEENIEELKSNGTLL